MSQPPRNANFLHCACSKGGAQNVAWAENITFEARVWRELYDRREMAAIRNRKLKLHLSWKVFLLLLLGSNHDPLCFSAHSGSNLQLPEPVILDTGI